MIDIKLICPNCGEGLTEAFAEANYGRVLLLDHCKRCGGVWFDHWELYHLKEADARRLDCIDIGSLTSFISHPKGETKCPRCDVMLEPFTDPSFPPDSLIMRCKTCGGLWLNHGELTKYGDHKEGIIGDMKSPETIIHAAPDEDRIEAVKKLGGILNLRNTGVDEETMEPELIDDKDDLKKDVAAIIFQILLKLIFRI